VKTRACIPNIGHNGSKRSESTITEDHNDPWHAVLGKTKFHENGTKILGDLAGMNSSDEFGFSRTGSDSDLEFGLVGNGTTGKAEDEASDGATGWRVGDMSSIDIANKL
jgi:hypothetical protein